MCCGSPWKCSGHTTGFVLLIVPRGPCEVMEIKVPYITAPSSIILYFVHFMNDLRFLALHLPCHIMVSLYVLLLTSLSKFKNSIALTISWYSPLFSIMLSQGCFQSSHLISFIPLTFVCLCSFFYVAYFILKIKSYLYGLDIYLYIFIGHNIHIYIHGYPWICPYIFSIHGYTCISISMHRDIHIHT